MNAEHIYRIASTGWWHCHGHVVESVAAWPRLTHSALVVLDLDDIFTDVWRFEGKSEYASALIEKRVRTEGLVDGAAHIVIHRLVKLPHGFQVFFSAVSLELWQRCTQWAKEQADHCVLMMAPSLLCHNVGNDKARLLLSQRRLMCFVKTEANMAFSSTQALGSSSLAMTSTVQTLMGSHSALFSSLAPAAVQWGTLWSTQSDDSDACLDAVSSALEGAPTILPALELKGTEGVVHALLPALAHEAASAQALNPAVDRMAWRAERWVMPVALVTAIVGLVLAVVGVQVGRLAEQQRVLSLNQRVELTTLQERIQAVSIVELPRDLLPLAEFSRAMADGARHDPVAFMTLLKAASGKDIRIQRVRLETPAGPHSVRAFRVDGVVTSGASTAVTQWVTQMVAAGWTLKAMDPSYAVPGAFSYELVATQTASGSLNS